MLIGFKDFFLMVENLGFILDIRRIRQLMAAMFCKHCDTFRGRFQMKLQSHRCRRIEECLIAARLALGQMQGA